MDSYYIEGLGTYPQPDWAHYDQLPNNPTYYNSFPPNIHISHHNPWANEEGRYMAHNHESLEEHNDQPEDVPAPDVGHTKGLAWPSREKRDTNESEESKAARKRKRQKKNKEKREKAKRRKLAMANGEVEFDDDDHALDSDDIDNKQKNFILTHYSYQCPAPPNLTELRCVVDKHYTLDTRKEVADGETPIRRWPNSFFVHRMWSDHKASDFKEIETGRLMAPPPAYIKSVMFGNAWDKIVGLPARQRFEDMSTKLKEEFYVAHPGFVYKPRSSKELTANQKKNKTKAAKKMTSKGKTQSASTSQPTPPAVNTPPTAVEQEGEPTFAYLPYAVPTMPTQTNYPVHQFGPASSAHVASYIPTFAPPMSAPAEPAHGLQFQNGSNNPNWSTPAPMFHVPYEWQQPAVFYPHGYHHSAPNMTNVGQQGPAQHTMFEGEVSYPVPAPIPTPAPLAPTTPAAVRVVRPLPCRAGQTMQSSPMVLNNSPALTNNAYSPASTIDVVHTPSPTKFTRIIHTADAGLSTRTVVSDIHRAGTLSLYAAGRLPPAEPRSTEVASSLLADVFEPEALVSTGHKRRASSQGGRSRVPTMGVPPPCVAQESILPQVRDTESAESELDGSVSWFDPIIQSNLDEMEQAGFSFLAHLGADEPYSVNQYDDYNF